MKHIKQNKNMRKLDITTLCLFNFSTYGMLILSVSDINNRGSGEL